MTWWIEVGGREGGRNGGNKTAGFCVEIRKHSRYFQQKVFNTGNLVLIKSLEIRENRSVQIMSPWLLPRGWGDAVSPHGWEHETMASITAGTWSWTRQEHQVWLLQNLCLRKNSPSCSALYQVLHESIYNWQNHSWNLVASGSEKCSSQTFRTCDKEPGRGVEVNVRVNRPFLA